VNKNAPLPTTQVILNPSLKSGRGIFGVTHTAALIAGGVVLLASAFLLFYHLGAESLQDYDEATYAEVSSESLASHHYFALTFLNQNYFRKPPAIFWAMDVSESFITNPEVAARLPSALSGLLLVALVMLFAYDATGSLWAGVAAGAVLATTSAFIEPARQARLDILVSLFIVGAVYAFYKAFFLRSWQWYVAFGALLGLAVLTKGPLAGYAVIPVLAIIASQRSLKWLFDPYFWASVATFFVVVVPWHVFETLHFGLAFWSSYLDDQVLDRVGQMLFNGPTNAQYIEYLFSFALPWSIVFCASIVACVVLWKKMQPKALALSAASISGVFTILIICSITKTKAFTYLIPLYPFMALAIGLGLREAGQEVSRRMHATHRKMLPTLQILLGLSFLILATYGFELSIYNGFHINSYYSTEVTLAQNEKAIAEKLLIEHATNFYVYDTTTLGSIMFYTKLTQPLGFTLGAIVPANSFILFPTTDLTSLQNTYPHEFSLLYQGSTLDLGELNAN
jgi:4-amino-4-deoxy-L-arabinose transferase-like glycosyltransferase